MSRQTDFHTKTFLEAVSSMDSMLKAHHTVLAEFGEQLKIQVTQQRELTQRYNEEQQRMLEKQRNLVSEFVTKQTDDFKQQATHTENVMQEQNAFSKVRKLLSIPLNFKCFG